MATVNITDKLIHAVMNHIGWMKQNEYSQINKRFANKVDVEYTLSRIKDADFIVRVTEQIWGEHYPLLAKIPAEWCNKNNRLQIQVMSPDSEYGGLNVYLTISGDNFLFMPKQDSYSARVRIPSTEFTPNLSLIESTRARTAEQSAVTERYAPVIEDVKTLLNSYTTLNKAVAAHPALLAYIPGDIKERLERVVIRTKSGVKADVIQPVIDSARLMATFMTHRITEGV